MTNLYFTDVLPDAAFLHAVARHDRSLRAFLPETALDPLAATTAAAAGAAERGLPRAALGAALAARQRDLGAPGASVASALRLGEPGTVCVVAGQQPGLLGGPHLSLSKGLAAVAAARRIESATSVPCVPVFWSAAEDHDHGEVDHVTVADDDGVLHRLRLPLPEDGRMLSHVPVPAGAAELLANLGRLLAGPHRDRILGHVKPRPGDTMGDWFGRIVLSLLGRFGVVLAEPALLRPFARDVVRHEIDRPRDLAARVRSGEDALAAAGFPRPLELPRPELFFLVEDGIRRRVTAENGGFRTATGDLHTATALRERLDSDPAAFSWNVAARVLAQDMALPVAAQVCGPSELPYVAALAPAHRALDLPVPALLPRPGVTFVDLPAARAGRRLGVEPGDVVRRGAAAIASPDLGAQSPDLAALRATLDALPEGSSAASRRRRRELIRNASLYGSALRRDAATADSVTARRRELLLSSLRPGGRLQERVHAPLRWLAGQGEGLMDRVLDAFADGVTQHVVLEIGPAGDAAPGAGP